MFPTQPQPEQARQPRPARLPTTEFPPVRPESLGSDVLRPAPRPYLLHRNVLAIVKSPLGVPPMLYGLLPPAIRSALLPHIARVVQGGLAAQRLSAPEILRAADCDATVTPVTDASQVRHNEKPPDWAVRAARMGS